MSEQVSIQVPYTCDCGCGEAILDGDKLFGGYDRVAQRRLWFVSNEHMAAFEARRLRERADEMARTVAGHATLQDAINRTADASLTGRLWMLCETCGHERGSHYGAVGDGPKGCHKMLGHMMRCECTGYVPRAATPAHGDAARVLSDAASLAARAINDEMDRTGDSFEECAARLGYTPGEVRAVAQDEHVRRIFREQEIGPPADRTDVPPKWDDAVPSRIAIDLGDGRQISVEFGYTTRSEETPDEHPGS